MATAATKKKTSASPPSDEFDVLVQGAINEAIKNKKIKKSTVTAPSDPTGGQKLPLRQSDQPDRKKNAKTQYNAVFDRNAQASDDQLDQWMRDTNELTGSPEKFVNDEDDTPADPDHEDEDARGNGEYNPLSEDGDTSGRSLEYLKDPDMYKKSMRSKDEKKKKEEAKRKKEKKMKKHWDDEDEDRDEDEEMEKHDDMGMDGDGEEHFIDDDDDLHEEDEEPEEPEENNEIGMEKAYDEDDDELEDDMEPVEDVEGEKVFRGKDLKKEQDRDYDESDYDGSEDSDDNKKMRENFMKSRRSQARKALGKDAMEIVDAFPIVKSLIDVVMDYNDEVKAQNVALRKLMLSIREELRKSTNLVRLDTRKAVKSLASGLASVDSREMYVDQSNGNMVRKSYGSPSNSRPKFSSGFDLAKSLDAIEDAIRANEEGITSIDLTTLENDKSPQNISRYAKEYLHKKGLA